jgi:hypothetical protein
MQNRSLIESDLRPMDRRQFVNMLGLGGVGLFLAPSLGQFANLLKGGSTAATGNFDLPEDWYRIAGQPLRGYAAFLGGLQMKHITVRQILEASMKTHGSIRAGIPPATMWKNMRPTLLVADRLSEKLREKVEVVISAYRCPAYNATCPGAASGSQHMKNVALDLVFQSSSTKVARAARELRATGAFKGGVGHYPDFTHVDTRGYNADWG